MTPAGTESVAVVTGAASGIGRCCAEVMRRSGWRTAGIDLNRSDTDLSLRADVSDRAAVAAAVDQVAQRFGQIDLLVSAAGDTRRASTSRTSPSRSGTGCSR